MDKKRVDGSLETRSVSSTFAFNLEGFIDGIEANVIQSPSFLSLSSS